MNTTNATELKSGHFSGLMTLFQNAHLLETSKFEIEKEKINYYLDLKTKEDVDRFINRLSDWKADLFYNITSLSKALFHCDLKELEASDTNNLIALLAAFGEIGAYLTEKGDGMTTYNTFPMSFYKKVAPE